MSSLTTYLTESEVFKISQASGDMIRKFLDFLDDPSEESMYWPLESELETAVGDDPEWKTVLPDYLAHPESFSNDKLMAYGECALTSHQKPIRMEVRRTEGVSGAAQIAVRGIAGDFRDIALAEFESRGLLEYGHILVKKGGHKSFEFNVKGVSKALPLAYLKHFWSKTLDQMGYTPGKSIDARESRTVLAADGDGTLYGKPHMDDLPGLDESVAKDALNQFLEHGGVFILVTGNSLARSVPRLRTAIKDEVKHRVIVAANGGADIAFFNQEGHLITCPDFRQNALNMQRADQELDLVYIGDDGDPRGNDYQAFEEAGFARSILVGKVYSGANEHLVENHIGGFEAGTKAFLDAVNGGLFLQLDQKVFAEENIKSCVEKARKVLSA